MNDLFSSSFARFRSDDQNQQSPEHHVQMSSFPPPSSNVNLDKFFEDVEGIKDELRELETLYSNLQAAHEQSKTVLSAKSVRDLRSRMDSDVSSALKKAKVIKVRLEALDRNNAANRTVPGCGPGSSSDRTRTSVVNGLRKKLQCSGSTRLLIEALDRNNAANWTVPGCGPGSSSDRTRTSVVNGLRKKLQDSMNSFNDLRGRIAGEYKETVRRRYYTVTGESADESVVDKLISTGESETFLAKAIQEQGRGKIMDTIMEIQERHEGVKEIERNLKELNQVFLDMAVLVEAQGEQIDDIESQVNRASSFVRGGAQQLEVARKHQRSTRKWTCIAIMILLVIALIVILGLKPWNWGTNNQTPSANNPTPANNPPPA